MGVVRAGQAFEVVVEVEVVVDGADIVTVREGAMMMMVGFEAENGGGRKKRNTQTLHYQYQAITYHTTLMNALSYFSAHKARIKARHTFLSSPRGGASERSQAPPIIQSYQQLFCLATCLSFRNGMAL